MVYQSTSSYASAQVIYSRRYDTQELFVVFRHSDGRLLLKPGEEIISAYFADELFLKSTDNAMPCLIRDNDVYTLGCKEALGRGIIIRTNKAYE